MKHIKHFTLFESDDRYKEYYKIREDIPNFSRIVRDISNEPIVREWLETTVFNDGKWGPEPGGDNQIVTPYGEKIEILIEEELDDFDGEGHSVEATGSDKYNIVYGLTGGFVRGYWPDEVVLDYDYEEDYYCWFDRRTDFPVMVSDLILKYPVVMIKIYDMLPEKIKTEVISEIDKKFKGEEREKIDRLMKGGSLLGRFQ